MAPRLGIPVPCPKTLCNYSSGLTELSPMANKQKQWIQLPGLAYKILPRASLWSFPSHELIHTGTPDLAMTVLLGPKFKGGGVMERGNRLNLDLWVTTWSSVPRNLNYSPSLLFERETNFLRPLNYCWIFLLKEQRLILINIVISERTFVLCMNYWTE